MDEEGRMDVLFYYSNVHVLIDIFINIHSILLKSFGIIGILKNWICSLKIIRETKEIGL